MMSERIEDNSLGFLQLFCAGSALTLEFGAPLLSLGVGLGELSLEVSFAVLLLLQLFAQGFKVGGEVADFTGQFLACLKDIR